MEHVVCYFIGIHLLSLRARKNIVFRFFYLYYLPLLIYCETFPALYYIVISCLGRMDSRTYFYVLIHYKVVLHQLKV